MSFHTIRWRIALPFVILILLTMLGVGIYLSSFIRQTYLSDVENQLTAEARLAADNLRPVLLNGGQAVDLDELAKRWAELLGARVTIIASDGRVLGESHEDRTRMDNHISRPEVVQARQSGQGSSTRFSQTAGYDTTYVAVAVSETGAILGYVRIALPLRQIQENINHLQGVLLSVTLLASLLAVLLALWIASRTTSPLRELTEVVGRMALGDLDAHLLPTTSDEVGQLTAAFNLMAAQLRSQLVTLESERSKMAAVLSEMTDGVIIVNQQGQVQLVNPAAEGMFEIHESIAVGRTLAETVRNHQVVDMWRHCQESGEAQSTVIEFNARRMYLQGVSTPLGMALPGSILLLFQDLTQLRRLETVRRDFISNISHELRTPLASLKALTETLQTGALEDPPAAHRFLQRMEGEVDAMSQMVAELLELARIESGRVPLQLEATSPREILQAAVDRLHLQAERAGLQVSIDCPDDLPQVLADASRIHQVCVNLLHNAIKFTPAGGQIRLSAVEREDGGKDQSGGKEQREIIFSVEDTGIGIPAEALPRIFERFYKADRARSSGGTGLGLAIARHLVEAHNGRIWAESTEGAGSSFFFSLPVVIKSSTGE